MTSAPPSWVGQQLDDGRYRVTVLIGEGGMASIFRAHDLKRNQDVVLKVPKPALLAEADFAHRFAREIRTLAELKHPAIVTVTGFSRHLGVPFAVLEHMPGGTLDDRPKPTPASALNEWLPNMAAALDFVHSKGYVHRDVKPSNILFDARGQARLSDFGIIKAIDEKAGVTQALTQSGVAIGTPTYMAPELAKGDNFDGRADQYALAVTVYEMLAGRPPIEGGTGPVILVKQIREKPAPLNEVADVTPELAAAVAKGLAKNPKNRYESCRQFSDAVLDAVAGRSRAVTPTHRSATVPIARSPKRSMAWAWISAGCVTLLFVGGVAIWFAQRPGRTVLAQEISAPLPAIGKTEASTSPSFQIVAKSPQPTYPGDPIEFTAQAIRINAWTGPLTLQLDDLPPGYRAQWTTKNLAADESHATIRLQTDWDVESTSITLMVKATKGEPVSTSVPIRIRNRPFAVQPLDDLILEPGVAKTVAIKVARNGWTESIALRLKLPDGIDAVPPTIALFPDRDEEMVTLRARPDVSSGEIRVLGGRDTVSFRVSVRSAPDNSARSTNSRTNAAPNANSVSRLIGKHSSEIVGLEFIPSSSNFVAWDASGGLAIWNPGSDKWLHHKALSNDFTRGIVSPDGRLIMTATKNRIFLHSTTDLRQVRTGNHRYRILGLCYDGIRPLVHTSAGLCDGWEGTLVDPQALGRSVTSIMYATGGRRSFVRDDGPTKLVWRCNDKQTTLTPPGGVERFNLSHDGKWLATASEGRVYHWSHDAPNVPRAGFPLELSNVTALAVSPDGQQVLAGQRNGMLRLLRPEVIELKAAP